MPRFKEKHEHFTKMLRHTMETPAWRGLSTTAQALYPFIKLEWKGPTANNNGSIQLSNRQASKAINVTIDTASRAFHDLQRKGFLVVTKPARLGLGGEAKSPCYELTELALPLGKGTMPRKLYKEWSHGNDFPVQKAMANNPKGHNGRKKPVTQIMTATSLK